MTPDDAPAASVVRTWAREKGLQVGARGRFAPELLAAYLADQAEQLGVPAELNLEAPPSGTRRRTSAPRKRGQEVPPGLPPVAVRSPAGWTVRAKTS